MHSNIITKLWIVILVMVTTLSCKKFLDTKPNQALSTPSSLKDLRALMDDQYLGKRGVGITQTSSDEYWFQFTQWNRYAKYLKDAHIWAPDTDAFSDWNTQYLNILTANTVLDHLKKIEGTIQPNEHNELKGEALFHRAQCFFQLAQIYSPQYDQGSAGADLGIVLRLDADFNKPSQRATVKQSYEQIIQDLEEAITILPQTTAYRTRPNKPAAYGLLARTYLQIGDHSKAKEAAEKCLQIYNTLIDYNDASEVDTLRSEPFLNRHINNKEILFYLNEDASVTLSSRAIVDSNLYRLYAPNDIRRAAFYTTSPTGAGNRRYKGSYNGILSLGFFVGVGTAEVYLIKAEANARLGNKDAALQDLNALLVKRYKTGTFVPLTASTSSQALDIILQERRKEMAFRGMRWADLKRLNKEPSRAITLTRNLNGQIYSLPPNDYRYALLIPRSVMQLANLQQNPR